MTRDIADRVGAIRRLGRDPLENVIACVALESIDPARHDRVVGPILSESPPPIDSAPAGFATLPVLPAHGASVHAP